MSGTAITSCAAVTVVTTTLFKSSVFYGAQYQSSTAIMTFGIPASTVSTIVTPFWGRVGPLYYTGKATTALTFASIISGGLVTSAA
jgi:hypothetical protein